MKKIIYIILAIILICGIVLVTLFGKVYYQHIWLKNIQKEHTVYILRNSITLDVYDSIVNNNLLKDTSGFYAFMIKKNYRNRNIVAGKYKIKAGWSNNELLNHLRAGNGRIESKITITPTRDFNTLSAKISREIRLDSATLANYLNKNSSWKEYSFNKQNRLCMFIPNTYFVDWDITCPEVLERMNKEYKKFWNQERQDKAIEINLKPNQIQTLASIVYWETKKKEDMPKVAGVYMNRLERGIPLQADPTLIFALGDYSIRRVLNKHKLVQSPYNTYMNKGLPPGPILISPTSYIDAVLNYEKHDYIFFVAKEDFSGYSYFSKTNAEHEKYANLYRKALEERGVRR